MIDTDSFTLAPGFRTAAVACGLKTSDAMAATALDLALVVADRPCSAAGVFTTNRVKAAPVLYDQEILAQNAGGIRAVIANAGCANACTGPQGMEDARRMAALAAYGLRCQPDEVLVLSTGVIGRRLDMDNLAQGVAEVTSAGARQGAGLAAQAIMTTDTCPKISSRQLAVGSTIVTISGFAKGAGMIHPNMATMLAVITTDAALAPDTLAGALHQAVARSFNRISVDGDMSTNDTVLLLASGASGIEIPTACSLAKDQKQDKTFTPSALSAVYEAFTKALTDVCVDLARQIARDGEGATRLVEIRVTGARDEAEAHQVADSIARSPLVKTAIHGGDPNWGRVVSAAGSSGADIDPDRLSLTFGPADRPGEDFDSPAVQVVANGMPTHYDERAAAATLHADPVLIALDLGLGAAAATVWTCDFSAEYIEINAHYTT